MEALEREMADYRRYGVSNGMMERGLYLGRNREGKGMTNNTKVI